MKRLLFVLSFILLTASLASAQQKEAVYTVVGDSIHDFGNLKKSNGAVTHTFKIKNTGKAPLVITRVEPGCGCTSREWTKEPIAPGKTGEIKVTFDPTGQSTAPFTKNVTVYSNGRAGSSILTIKGIIEDS